MADENKLLSRYKLLLNKKERVWNRVQICYDLIKKLPENLEVFKIRASQLPQVFDEFNKIMDELTELSESSEDIDENTIEISKAFESLYFSIQAEVVKYLPAANATTANKAPDAHLPEIQINKFDGRAENFPAFIALYDDLIHNTDLPNIKKFSYLMNYLQGPPLQLVQTITFAPDNYTIAYQMLKDRYTNKRVLANHYLSIIFNLSPIKSNSSQAIRELADTLQANITSLNRLNLPDIADYIILQFSLRLLTSNLRNSFEQHTHDKKTFPTFNDFIRFLNDKSIVSDLAISSSHSPIKSYSIEKPQKQKHIAMTVNNSQNSQTSHFRSHSQERKLECPLCKSPHKLINCSSFLATDPKARYDIVKSHKRCFACLGTHTLYQCKSSFSCRRCDSKRHNTLLHFEDILQPQTTSNITQVESDTNISLQSVSLSNPSLPGGGMLGTAKAKVLSSNGQWITCRLVLDTGSSLNFITSSFVSRLGLKRKKGSYNLEGLAQTPIGFSQNVVEFQLSSNKPTKEIHNFSAIILNKKITSDLPLIPISDELRKKFAHLDLADPEYHKPAPLDILLGVGAVMDLTPSQSFLIKGYPSAALTTLGWVIQGNMPENNKLASLPAISMFTHILSENSIDQTLRKFWEVEEIPDSPQLSEDDKKSEEYYSQTTTRSIDGRYSVRLPFKEEVSQRLGCNREIALKRFLQLEKRFKLDKEFYTLYSENIQDYISRGHLVPAPQIVPYILTHHGVKKQSPKGLNVRVVFNPAEKGSNNISLNETLLSGPKLQSDISQIITRFRLFRVALTCDIKSMFREIEIHPDDRKFQHIFWRFSSDEPLIEYEHTRVIFGATSSPFLAQRTVAQLVQDEGLNYPMAANALKSHIYVDDILTGADSELEACKLRNQLIDLLKAGGFELGKWASSNSNVIYKNTHSPELVDATCSNLKVLGLTWNPDIDSFSYLINSENDIPTKRGILSRVARIYDVNGYISPVVFSFKSLLQYLWTIKADWDEPLPSDITTHWNNLISELPLLSTLNIPRCVIPNTFLKARLVGFSDASLKGMAAVIYLRLELIDRILVNILTSKTRVAPLKSWTIPRLELGAACLLSKLIKTTSQSLVTLSLDSPVCFTDSTTALSWIRTPPYLLKTFVSNRVVQIHENSLEAQWRHVAGLNNPADLASRGLYPSELLNSTIWWRGPDFVYTHFDEWPCDTSGIIPNLPETKEINIIAHVSSCESSPFFELFTNARTFLKLQRTIAYVFRFSYRMRRAINRKCLDEYFTGPLCVREYSNAILFAIKTTQEQYLSDDIRLLTKASLCSKRYRTLSPFLSPQGFVMVGGRLRKADIPYQSRHPFLIPSQSRLAKLLVDHFHSMTAHGGPQLIQSLLHRKYWIPGARNLIRKRIHKCLVCYRFKANPIHPPMGDLPSYRLRPSRCFTHTGIDFAGPFSIKASILRSKQTVKCYFALFVCMVTKALHVEVVTSLTTACCLAAIDRFIARRGLPNHIYSDQGRNFKGAARTISEISQFLKQSKDELAHYLALRQIEWHFNPPYSPNMGGLFEAGVKSVKFHFKRVIGSQILNLEEFQTILVRIEGILNSRPLCSVSNSPDDDPDCLTPGHFLIGGPILSRPEIDLTDEPKNRLTRWQLTRQLIQSFWTRWSREYIHTQIHRPKWHDSPRTLSKGDLVFWFSPGMLPAQWPKGIVTELLAGDDGIARVVKIRTATGDIVRPVSKVIPLPSA